MKQLAFSAVLVSFLSGCSTTTKAVDPYQHLTEQQTFEAARTAILDERYTTANEALEALLSQHAYGKKAERAKLWSIYTHYKAGEDIEAIAAANEYMHLYPQSKYNDYVYYLKGVVYYHEGGSWLQRLVKTDPARRDLTPMQRAFDQFHVLVQMFPRSSYVKPAREMMHKIGDVFAQHELEIAQFYAKRGEKAAAQGRIQELLKRYPTSAQAKVAKQLLKTL